MLKVFTWHVSNDNRFIQNAVTVLKNQHGGIEIVGSSTGEDISKVDWGGI
ncbi:MAG: hypothetical protein IJP68_00295 [Selenomonadaceae bacterium]|nr:hypothetical protein [Selenomonadaceae bacterium]